MLKELKQKIENIPSVHHIGFLKILKNMNNITINENQNGIFVNLTSLNKKQIQLLVDHVNYIDKQTKTLTDIEVKKEMLENEYFKCNKDNSLSV